MLLSQSRYKSKQKSEPLHLQVGSREVSILFISDVHADIRSLEAILSIIADGRFKGKHSEVQLILNLGDTVERGYHPEQVINKLRELEKTLPAISLRGNHDEALLLGYPVSGSDLRSRQAHANSDAFASFLKDLPDCYLNEDDRILAVHGGPIDPHRLGDDWLYQRIWQRISSRSYLDASGYHYTPQEAFEFVKQNYGDGYIILCGHDHNAAAYSDRQGSLLEMMHIERSRCAGYEVTSRGIIRDPHTSYLVRVGIAGPEGYHRSGLDRSHFGLISQRDSKERIELFSFASA
jgi:predicted MPP superfamily phosphohydrolase